MEKETLEKMPEEPENPMKKVYKSRKQKVIEDRKDFVPIMDAKQTIEVQVKPKPSREEIEIIEPRNNKSEKEVEKALEEKLKKSKVKKAKRTTEEKVRKSKKIEILTGNSILIITEKPQAAAKIAAALSKGKEAKYSEQSIPYYEFNRENNKTKEKEHIIVACAVGHLFSLSQDKNGSDYPIFNISWKPNYEVRKKDFTRKYYSLLSKLVKRAKEIILATDFDTEGEVIGYNIIRFIAHQKDAKRMKFSSLTAEELEEAFTNAHPTIEWGQAIAGETRHFIDWYYGINLSRALMSSIKSAGKFRIMSIGRVQGPALKLIVEKENEIQAFKPKPFWKIFINVQEQKDKTNKAKLRHVKDIFEEKELKKFENLKGKTADVKTENHSQTLPPLPPFDLTTLQTESYKFFSLTPAKTLELAQSLYLAGLISYPRTSSQKIPEAINPKNILKRLSKYFKDAEKATRQKPIEGKKSDPAHPAITPTGEFQSLDGDEKKIYELIVKRFIACFCSDALIENKTITATAENNKENLLFKERGLEVREPGWMEVYSANLQEKELRDMNGKADILKVDIEKDETKPPRRFSPASILSELEKRNLGTKATRANIIETLYDRGYVSSGENKAVLATPLGINLIETLKKHSPIIIDENLTRNMEKDMDHLRESKHDLDKKQLTILKTAQNHLVEISKDFKSKEEKIGKELVKAEQAYWKQQNEQNELNFKCPLCEKGKLTIKFSPKNKKHFIACTNYPNCKQTFSLPPYGLIKQMNPEKFCDKCNFPLMMSIQKAKRPWIFCFNPTCPTRLIEGVYAHAKKDETLEKKEIEMKDSSEEGNIEQ